MKSISTVPKFFFSILLMAILLFGLQNNSRADSFDDAVKLYNSGDYKEVARIFKVLAEQGHVVAQSNLGFMYEKGQGVPQDYKESVKWYRRAAEQGDVLAQNNLGHMYANGRGVRLNKKEAMKWHRQAAEQGNAQAQFELGSMYMLGVGVPRDYKEAEKWSRKAAEQGIARAQNYLGFMYDIGQGVPKDYIQAHKWFNLAVSGEKDDQTRKLMVDNRNIVEKKMTPGQIAEAQKLAREWEPRK